MTTLYRYGTHIKIKTGCIECPEGNNKPIKAKGRCQYHYDLLALKARQDKIRTREPEQPKDDLWTWYQERLRECKMRCEETGDRIYPQKGKEHWHICHVLDKSIFPSVSTHPLNWIELDWQSHKDFDYYKENFDERLFKMRIFPSVISVVQQLAPFVKEKRRLNKLIEFFNQKTIQP